MSRAVGAVRTERVAVAAVALLASACAPLARGPDAPAPLTLAGVADSVAETPPLDRTHWGVEFYDPATGRVPVRRNAEKHFIPASNMKLVVTATALAELGPEFRYRTPVLAVPGPEDSVAAALVVVGRGDPSMSARYHGSEWAVLDSLADSVALAGVARVAGELVVDASYFEPVGVHPTWEVGDLDWYYAAAVSPFSVAEGAFGLVVTPGAAPGEPVEVTLLAPPGLAAVANRLTTGPAGERADWELTRLPGTDSLVLEGTVPASLPADTAWVAMADPALFGARALELALEARGVEVEGGVRVVRDTLEARALLADGPAPRELAVWSSPPLSDIVAGILKPSQNLMAEQLLKTLGAEVAGRGSWRAGTEVERRFLVEAVGVDPGAVRLVDGSGLSAQNLLTPAALVRLLAYAAGQPWGGAYRRALAEPGETGTLRRRLEGLEGRVQAKTGTISNVATLSGYLTTDGRRVLVFSIMANGTGRPSGQVRKGIDRIVRAAARGR